jgi:arylsulfatase A-like enzyme
VKRLLKISNLLILALIGFTGCSKDAMQKKNDQDLNSPNVVIIFMDDMGYGDLSSFGHPTIQTPNIDNMAQKGQKWTNFYVASAVCSPSRGALLTGRYPVRIGLGGENKRVFFPNSIGGLPPEEFTIAELLKKRGYKTAAIGKWHLGHLPEFLPTNQGFDYYYGIPYSNDMDEIKWSVQELLAEPDIHKWNVPLMENETIIERPANQFTITKRYTDKAVEFITNNQDQPFFLYLPHTMVHTPLFVSDDFVNTSSRGIYGDVMAEIDWSVGEIINTLEKLNLAENTLVVLSSDNGPWLMMKEHGGSAGLLKDGKGTTWEGGMRVPGIFYMPGTVKPGIIEDMGSTLDLLPTIATMTSSELPKELLLDGYDLSSVLTEKATGARDHFFYYRKQDIYAVRKGDYKAHFITESSYKSDNEKTVYDKPVLYNLNIDPSEKYNRANAFPNILEDLRNLVDSHKKTVTIRTSELDKYPITKE